MMHVNYLTQDPAHEQISHTLDFLFRIAKDKTCSPQQEPRRELGTSHSIH